MQSETKQRRHQFRVWAPLKKAITLQIVAPFENNYPMQPEGDGYFTATIASEAGELRYRYQWDEEKGYPDPGSHFQPEGVHGPSQTVDHAAYQWTDAAWKGLPLEAMILYEVHVGTFTPEGTFEAIIPRLDSLKDCGINALELMPVTQFPGDRNWGYDGVFPYAVQASYGGPEGLKKLVDACHQKGIAVLLDVVYNHLGPEGNYFSHFGPYFTNNYCTPWGDAINFDGEWSDGVREYFANNVLHWLQHYHIDGLRCDAIHAVYDNGAVHFWELVHSRIKSLEQESGKQFHLIAESDLNSPRVIRSPENGGYGFDAQWLDDFHHALYVLINPADKERYYDFGTMEQLAKAYTDGFVHSGEWVQFRKRKHGRSSAGVPGNQFIAFNLNHDQAGNRAGGERLCMLVGFERVKLAAAALLLAPYVPMLFMGEEYADNTPFFYFVSHSDEALIKAVQEGRKAEFKDFGFDGEIPDPQDAETFNRSKIRWGDREKEKHQVILKWHKTLIQLRNEVAALQSFEKKAVHVTVINQEAFILIRKAADKNETLCCFFNLSENETSCTIPVDGNGGKKILDSTAPEWLWKGEHKAEHPEIITEGGRLTISPLSVVVYQS